jgi:[ribosomal protein S5]-alanine N-acetyltransferase
MELQLERCTIRNYREGDASSLARHANNYKIWRNLRDRFPYPYTLQDAVDWIQLANATEPVTSFAIEIAGEVGGGIGLLLKDDVYCFSAEIGYWLGEPFWGRGITTEAVRALTEYSFDTFPFHRIYAEIFEWNPASMRVLEKAGYQFEGRLRKSVVKDGQVLDAFIYAIVR